VKVGRPDDPGRRARFRNLENAVEIRCIGKRRAAVCLGNEHRVQAQRVDRVDVLARELAAAVVLGRFRRDAVSREIAHAFDEHALLKGVADARVEAIEDAQCAIPWPPSM
jgi:hypothetical protein